MCGAQLCKPEIKKRADEFDKWILSHFKDHGRTLVCKTCCADGYSVRSGGLETHVCIKCGPGGHDKFDKQNVRDKKRRPKMFLLCYPCKKAAKQKKD